MTAIVQTSIDNKIAPPDWRTKCGASDHGAGAKLARARSDSFVLRSVNALAQMFGRAQNRRGSLLGGFRHDEDFLCGSIIECSSGHVQG